MQLITAVEYFLCFAVCIFLVQYPQWDQSMLRRMISGADLLRQKVMLDTSCGYNNYSMC